MRIARTVTLAGLLLAAAPASATAATADVTVGDDFFAAPTVKVQPGDTVNWRWDGFDAHNVVSSANQTEKFRSGLKSGTGKTFAHTFAKPGRFTYVCEIHDNMRGSVEVGPPPFPDTSLPRLTGLKAKVSGSSIKVSFRLSERSKVQLSLSGPSKKSTGKTLGKGKRSITLRHLKDGKYRATVRPTDKVGNKGRSVKSKRVSLG